MEILHFEDLVDFGDHKSQNWWNTDNQEHIFVIQYEQNTFHTVMTVYITGKNH